MARALLVLLLVVAPYATAQTFEIDQRIESALTNVFSLAWDRLFDEIQGDAELAAQVAPYRVAVTASGLIMTDVPFDAQAWYGVYGDRQASLPYPMNRVIPLHDFVDAAALSYFLRFNALTIAREVGTELFFRVSEFRPGVTVVNGDRRELLVLLVEHTRVGPVQFTGPAYLMTADSMHVIGEIYDGRSRYLRLDSLRAPGGDLTPAGRAYRFFGLTP